jgi:hypothetical protein
MTLRHYLMLMSACTVLAWITVTLIVVNVDPEQTQIVVFGALYASLFLAFTGTFSIIGFLSRVILLKKAAPVSVQVAMSFRQSIMLALLLVIALWMQGRGFLTWWNALLLATLVTVLESFFMTARPRNGR